MSRPFRDKNKDLVKLKVLTSDDVWTKNKSGKLILKNDIEIYGRIDKGTSAFISSTNISGKNHKTVDNTVNLPKKAKNEVVNALKNNNRKVVYLVKCKEEKRKEMKKK